MKLTITALTIAGAAGAGLLTYSPMPCACESTWQLVYAAAGLSSDFPYKYYTPAEVEMAMNRNLVGAKIRGSSSYYYDACKPEKPGVLRCIIDTEQAGRRKRGYLIKIEVDQRGMFKKAHVSLHRS